LTWAEREWCLNVDGDFPGLSRPGLAGSILSLDGVAAIGRADPKAFHGGNLRNLELFRGRVQATYSPPDWSGLKVRAAWSPDESGRYLDLEVQATARSVGELRALEVIVTSQFLDAGSSAGRFASWVRPRDIHAAALSYDGRVPADELARLTTLPIPLAGHSAFGPIQVRSPWSDVPGCYFEMVHPHDVSRQIILGTTGTEPPVGFAVGIRHALFGHDLEKGVALRGRLRATWEGVPMTESNPMEAYRELIESSPPLGM
jgi:hypothetical protein